MKYKYYYCQRYRSQLVDFLKENKIKYQIKPYVPNVKCIIFTLYSSMKDIKFYMEELEKINVKNPLVNAEYSAKEYSAASFLWMYPKSQYVDLLNEEESYRYLCHYGESEGQGINHEEQVADLVIRKVPSSKTSTAFWTFSTGWSELFTDIRVKQLAEEYALKGLKFRNVYLKNGECCDSFFQLMSSDIIKKECIEFNHGEKVCRCPGCGKEQYYYEGTYQLYLDVSKIQQDVDLYFTEKIFGEGVAHPLFIISQRFYRLLKENKLAGRLNLSPVVDVSGKSIEK